MAAYRRGEGFVYRLDPRVKLLLTPFFTLLVFIVDRPLAAAGMTLLFAGIWIAARIPLKKAFARAKMLAALVALIAALQILFGSGLVTALVIACRLVTLILIMPLLTLTTPPHLLALGLTRLGLPYRAAYTLTAAFNLIPSFEEEGRAIMEARKLRGAHAFEEGGPLRRLKEYPALALPLIINAMRRAQMMGIVMDARAFGAYRTRTWPRRVTLSARDYAAFAAGAVCAALILLVNFAL